MTLPPWYIEDAMGGGRPFDGLLRRATLSASALEAAVLVAAAIVARLLARFARFQGLARRDASAALGDLGLIAPGGLDLALGLCIALRLCPLLQPGPSDLGSTC
jgi:hypothetical protein